MSSRREMHPYRQTPSVRDPPTQGQVSPYGQIPPQEYFNNPVYSNMASSGQVYGSPPADFPPSHSPYSVPSSSNQIYGGVPMDDQQQHYVMTSPYCAIPFQLSAPMPSTHNEDYRHTSLVSSNDNVATQNRSQTFDGQTSLRTIAQQARALMDLQDDDTNSYQSAYQKQGPQQQIASVEQFLVEQPRSEPSVSQLVEVGQKSVEEPAVDTSVTLDPIDQEFESFRPVSESETKERQNMEVRSTSQTYPSPDSMTPVPDAFNEEGKEDSDQEATDDEIQQVATTLQSEDDIDKVDKYAFNFVREAYDHRVPQQLTKGITFHVNSLAPMTTTLKQRREEVNDDSTPTLLPQPHEYQKGSKTVECVWIGMLPSPDAVLQMQSQLAQSSEEPGAEGNSKKPTKKRGLKKSRTVSNMRDEEMKIIAFDQNALRVVAKKSDKVTKDIHIYALVQPHYTSALQGFKVGFDDVFFFREFRDDSAKSIMPRKKAAIAKIKASVFGNVMSQSRAPTAEQSLDQSPSATTALSPLSSLSSTNTPTPPPGLLSTRKSSVSRPSRNFSTSENTHGVSDLSQLVPSEESKIALGSRKSRKRKAQNPLLDVLMNQREEARKKAKAEGYEVPDSDSELHDTVENDDQKSTDVNSQDDDLSMSSVNDYSADDDVVIAHDSSTSHDIHKAMKSQRDLDDEAFPEHAVHRHDPGFVNHMNDLINLFALEKSTADKSSHKTPFRLGIDQGVNKDGQGVSSGSTDREDHDSDEPLAHSRNSAVLANKIKSLANELANEHDVVGLQQALTMVRCVRKRRGPPKTSALSLYFNVTNSKDVRIEDCVEQLKQLRALFPTLEDEIRIQGHVLAWMAKGLQLTGQSLNIDILPYFLVAFAKQYDSKFGTGPEGQKSHISLNVLVDMICSARDKAEEMLRLRAIERGADLVRLEAGGECPSHPYIDPDEEVVHQPAIWESPKE